ncbi:MAG: hypothetical protein AAGF83_09745 [Cyanobacteria bacterium P01_G01_bin.67]
MSRFKQPVQVAPDNSVNQTTNDRTCPTKIQAIAVRNNKVKRLILVVS